MAGRTEVVRTYHAAGRSHLALFFVPLLLIPLVLWGLATQGHRLVAEGEGVPFWWYIAAITPLALIVLWSRVVGKLTTRFTISLDAIEHSLGFVSRSTSMIRIADIRNITVKQSVLDRVLNIGDVAFSSAAGTQEEVIFRRVSSPESIKRLVKDIQDRLIDDGQHSDSDRRAIMGQAGRGAAPSKPAAPSPAAAPRASAEPASDPGARDELYRLLAEQEAEANKKGGH